MLCTTLSSAAQEVSIHNVTTACVFRGDWPALLILAALLILILWITQPYWYWTTQPYWYWTALLIPTHTLNHSPNGTESHSPTDIEQPYWCSFSGSQPYWYWVTQPYWHRTALLMLILWITALLILSHTALLISNSPSDAHTLNHSPTDTHTLNHNSRSSHDVPYACTSSMLLVITSRHSSLSHSNYALTHYVMTHHAACHHITALFPESQQLCFDTLCYDTLCCLSSHHGTHPWVTAIMFWHIMLWHTMLLVITSRHSSLSHSNCVLTHYVMTHHAACHHITALIPESQQLCLDSVCYDTLLGLARTVYIDRIWPCIWWFSCKKYRIYTVYIYGSGPTLHIMLLVITSRHSHSWVTAKAFLPRRLATVHTV